MLSERFDNTHYWQIQVASKKLSSPHGQVGNAAGHVIYQYSICDNRSTRYAFGAVLNLVQRSRIIEVANRAIILSINFQTGAPILPAV